MHWKHYFSQIVFSVIFLLLLSTIPISSSARRTDDKPALPEIIASAPDAPPIKSGELYGIKYGEILVPETVTVHAGNFKMGQPHPNNTCTGCSRDEQPVHLVEISEFEMGRFEVTNAQYALFATESGRDTAEWRQYYRVAKENHPVINVSWADAQAYCAWLQAITGRAYRLPTEAEWEFAARGGVSHPFNEDDGPSPGEARFSCKDGTTRVGKYKPNRYGLYDMLGNAWEWCADWYGDDYYTKSPLRDPQGPTQGQYRVMRGGSWLSTSDLCRVSNRTWFNPGYIMDGRGFRVAVGK